MKEKLDTTQLKKKNALATMSSSDVEPDAQPRQELPFTWRSQLERIFNVRISASFFSQLFVPSMH